MHQLVQQGERMRGVVVVDDDEGSQVIGQRETAEDVLADIPASAIALAGVMKPQDCMLSSRKVTKPEPGILKSCR